jgi:hypothetical protein
MHEKLRSVAAFVLVLSALAVSTAQETLTAQQVVERFAEALSAGNAASAFSFLALSGSWSEHDLYWRTSTGRDLQIRAYELIRADIQLETDVVAVVGDGQVVIARERMWGDFVPEDMAPLRSTTMYVVESGWVVGITRVLSPEQRDALLLATLADSTWSDGFGDGSGNVYHRFGADGTYRNFDSLEDMRADRHLYSGTYAVEHGVFTYVADERSKVCHPGERLVMRNRMVDGDTSIDVLVREETDCAYYLERLTEPYTTFRLAED